MALGTNIGLPVLTWNVKQTFQPPLQISTVTFKFVVNNFESTFSVHMPYNTHAGNKLFMYFLDLSLYGMIRLSYVRHIPNTLLYSYKAEQKQVEKGHIWVHFRGGPIPSSPLRFHRNSVINGEWVPELRPDTVLTPKQPRFFCTYSFPGKQVSPVFFCCSYRYRGMDFLNEASRQARSSMDLGLSRE